MSKNPTMPFICPCLHSPKTPLLQLDPEQYYQLKADGKFLRSVRSNSHKVDLSTHVAAQNGIGWKKDGNVFKPVGASHAACVLKYSGFSIDEGDFTPAATPAQVQDPGSHIPPQVS